MKKILHKISTCVLKTGKAIFCIIAVLLGAVSPDVVNNAETPEEMDRLIEKELFGRKGNRNGI